MLPKHYELYVTMSSALLITICEIDSINLIMWKRKLKVLELN